MTRSTRQQLSGIAAGLAAALSVLAQTSASAPAAGAETVDAAVRGIYEGVSHAPGEEPDWSRLRALFLPEGRFILPKRPADPAIRVVDLEGFIALATKGIATRKQQ